MKKKIDMKLGDKYYRETDIPKSLTEIYLTGDRLPYTYTIVDLQKLDNGFQEIKLKYNHPHYKEVVVTAYSGFDRLFVKADDLAYITKLMSDKIDLLDKNFDVLLRHFMK